MLGLRKAWVAGDEFAGVFAGFGHDGGIANQIGHAERRQAVLAGADQVAGAAELKIDFGEFESVGGIDEGLQSLLGIVSRIVCKDTAVAGEDATADPAAHLMELGEAETVGAEDRHQRGVGNVDADFDDRRGEPELACGRRQIRRGRRLFLPRSCGRG